MDTFWIAMVAGAIFIGCGLGVASLTNEKESVEDERLRQEREWRERNQRERE
jgi:hypothetical protein